MPHEPGHDEEECPPPTGGGFRPVFPNKKIRIGTTGTYRVYSKPELDCAAIVTWVHPVRDGEQHPRVNVQIFLNGNHFPWGMLAEKEIRLWGMPGQPDYEHDND